MTETFVATWLGVPAVIALIVSLSNNGGDTSSDGNAFTNIFMTCLCVVFCGIVGALAYIPLHFVFGKTEWLMNVLLVITGWGGTYIVAIRGGFDNN